MKTHVFELYRFSQYSWYFSLSELNKTRSSERSSYSWSLFKGRQERGLRQFSRKTYWSSWENWFNETLQKLWFWWLWQSSSRDMSVSVMRMLYCTIAFINLFYSSIREIYLSARNCHTTQINSYIHNVLWFYFMCFCKLSFMLDKPIILYVTGGLTRPLCERTQFPRNEITLLFKVYRRDARERVTKVGKFWWFDSRQSPAIRSWRLGTHFKP